MASFLRKFAQRLFDVLMRRRPWLPIASLREVTAWLRRRRPAAALAMNQTAMSSMRFMLEAAGIEEAEGASGGHQAPGLGDRLGAFFGLGSR